MAEFDDLLFGGGVATPPDRRRPGRQQNASPELIPLLRQPIPLGIEAALLGENTTDLLPERVARPRYHPHDSPDDLRAARGVLFGLAISVGFWLLCFLAMRLLAGD